MIRYYDCDGVTLDTERELTETYYALKKVMPQISADWYYSNVDWKNWIETHGDLNGAIEILRGADPSTNSILTSINSIDELKYKVLFFRSVGVTIPVIGVPAHLKKSLMVDPVGNILVDDKKHNLEDWDAKGGLAIDINEINSLMDVILMDEDTVKERIKNKQKRLVK